jgi:hypothetical protein
MHRLHRRTPLHDACGLNLVKCAAELIKIGADINKTHEPSRPPIFDSIDGQSHECIELLLNVGASLKFVDVQRNGFTILYWFANHGDRRKSQIFASTDLAGLDSEQKGMNRGTVIQLFDRERPNVEADIWEALWCFQTVSEITTLRRRLRRIFR